MAPVSFMTYILSTLPHSVLNHASRDGENKATEKDIVGPVIAWFLGGVLVCCLIAIFYLLSKRIGHIPQYITVFRARMNFRRRNQVPVTASNQPEGLRYGVDRPDPPSPQTGDRPRAAAPRAEDAGVANADPEHMYLARIGVADMPSELPPAYGGWAEAPRSRPAALDIVLERGQSRGTIMPPAYSSA